jgi:hypothetical protein
MLQLKLLNEVSKAKEIRGNACAYNNISNKISYNLIESAKLIQ